MIVILADLVLLVLLYQQELAAQVGYMELKE